MHTKGASLVCFAHIIQFFVQRNWNITQQVHSFIALHHFFVFQSKAAWMKNQRGHDNTFATPEIEMCV